MKGNFFLVHTKMIFIMKIVMKLTFDANIVFIDAKQFLSLQQYH
jgi:hypothetical protein